MVDIDDRATFDCVVGDWLKLVSNDEHATGTLYNTQEHQLACPTSICHAFFQTGGTLRLNEIIH